MKKYLKFAVFSLLTIVLILPFSVSAKTKAGTKPGSFFYFFDKAFEKADLFFTFSPEKKAKKALENADERLAEAEESASENNQEAVAEAMENYQENIEVLEKVLNKVPEEAKQAIEKAIEASKKGRGEADEKTTEPKKEVSEIKQEIEKLKQNKESQLKINESSEIEKLQKEIEELKQKVEKQSNKNTKLDISPVNAAPSNTIVCNGKNWTNCPMGQKFYCPSTGDAQCLIDNVSNQNNSGDSLLKIEKCKAEKDKKRAEMETLITPMVENLFNDCFNSVVAEANKLKEEDERTGGIEALTRFQLGTAFCKSRKEPNTAAFQVKFDQLVSESYSTCLNR